MKGVQITEAATLARLDTQAIEFGMPTGRTYLCSTPLFHGGARSFALAHLLAGGTVTLRDRFDAAQWLVELREASFAFVVPSMLRRILRLTSGPPLTSVTLIISGAPLDNETLVAARQHVTSLAYDYYASVDAGPIAVRRPDDRADEGTVGRPCYGVEVEVRSEDGSPVASGEVGRLVVRGPGTASGYVGDAAASRRAFLPASWVATGDAGSLDESGRLRLAGRVDDVIVTGGVNVHPLTVEKVLRALPGVADVVVAGIPDREWGELVSALVTARAGVELDPEAIKAAVHDQLSPAQRPRLVRIVDAVPLTPLGKPDRRAARTLLEESV